MPLIPEYKRRMNYNHTYPVRCSTTSVPNHTECMAGISTTILPIHFVVKSIQCFSLFPDLWQNLHLLDKPGISC